MNKMQTVATWLAIVLVAGCQARGAEPVAVVYQSVAAVQVDAQTRFELQRSFSGVLRPAQRSDLAFEFPGTMQAVLVNEGDRVEQGELLAQLDTALLTIERRQLQAQLSEAEANLRLAKANLARQSSLETDGFASKQRRDELEAGRDAINASISNLQAALDGNRVRQEKSHMAAPFAGVISERYLEEGSAVGAGAPVLRILEIGRMEAHVGVPQKLAQNLHTGDSVSVIVADQTVQGEILAVGAELKAQSHTAKVRISLPVVSALSGSLVKLQLTDHINEPGFTVPQAALTASLRGLWRVYVLLAQGDDLYRVEARDLQVRYMGEETAYVEGGLADGELVLSGGVQKIVPGQIVRLVTGGTSR